MLLAGRPERAACAPCGAARAPVVINKWASWCVPCRAEFGAFQGELRSRSAAKSRSSGSTRATRAAATALAFLRSFPVSYPSYYDHSGALGTAITDSSFTPATVFYNRAGGRYIRQGAVSKRGEARSGRPALRAGGRAAVPHA